MTTIGGSLIPIFADRLEQRLLAIGAAFSDVQRCSGTSPSGLVNGVPLTKACAGAREPAAATHGDARGVMIDADANRCRRALILRPTSTFTVSGTPQFID